MEICEKVAQSGNKRLHAKFKHALNVIDRTLALYSFEEVAFSFNGGKDSTALLHLLKAGYAVGEARLTSSAPTKNANRHRICTIYFESPDAFPEIDLFTLEIAKFVQILLRACEVESGYIKLFETKSGVRGGRYDLEMEIILLDFKSGMEALLKRKPIKAIFLGTRNGDPNAVGQEEFVPSSAGWPPFMRVNPILDWSYRDVWAFLLACKVPYCSLYDRGYTSIGSIHDTVPNGALCITIDDSHPSASPYRRLEQPAHSKDIYRPAYLLRDERLERAGRLKKNVLDNGSASGNGMVSELPGRTLLTASIMVVADDILRGEGDDHVSMYLSKALFSIGWTVTRRAILPNDIDAVSEEIRQRASVNDMVLVTGGVGPMHSDVTLAGVAKAFGVHLAAHKEFEEHLQRPVDANCFGDQKQMAMLPEGITEYLEFQDCPFPVIKCKNVFVLLGSTVEQVAEQWQSLVLLSQERSLFHNQQSFTCVRLCTSLSYVEIARPLSQIEVDFVDITFGCFPDLQQLYSVKGQQNSEGLVLSIFGENMTRVKAAADALRAAVPNASFLELQEG